MADIDYGLRRQVDELQDLVVRVGNSVSAVSQQVETVGYQQREVQGELADLRQQFLSYMQQSQRQHHIQVAETRIGTLQDELEHTYGHHKLVRQSAVGMLQAFDTGLVSEKAVRSISEQLMVQTPRYWLAPVLVGLAAWAGDNPQLCDRAVAEAFRRSPDRTSLFFALVLRRQGRQESAVRWLRHYLNAQDPAALGRDFAVILESISQGAFGPAGRELIREHTGIWRQRLLEDESSRQAQVDRWRAAIDAHVPGSAADRYPRLAKASPQWQRLDQVLARAGAHQPLLRSCEALAAAQPEPVDRLEDMIDDILDRLVHEYDPEELPLQRELFYHRAVVDQNGDTAAAQQAAATQSAALETTLDYLTIQTESALNPAAIGVSRATQRMAAGICHDWFAQAHAAFTMDYRADLPAAVTLALGKHHNSGAETVQLPTWTGSFNTPLDQLADDLELHWDKHGQSYVDGLAYDVQKPGVILVVVMLLSLIPTVSCLGIAGMLVSMAGAAIWAIVIAVKNNESKRKQEQARELVERSKQDSLAQLRAARAELTDWNSAFEEADSNEAAVRTAIAELATIGQAHTPYERRVVASQPVPHTLDGASHEQRA